MIPFGQILEGPFVGMITPFIAIVGVHFVCDIGGTIKVAGDSMYFPILNEERSFNNPRIFKIRGLSRWKVRIKVQDQWVISRYNPDISRIYPICKYR